MFSSNDSNELVLFCDSETYSGNSEVWFSNEWFKWVGSFSESKTYSINSWIRSIMTWFFLVNQQHTVQTVKSDS